MSWRGLLVACSLIMLGLSAGAARAADESFVQWQQQFTLKARNAGISNQVIVDALADLTVDDYVVELDHKQPEDKLSYTQYKTNTVNAKRIADGRELLAHNRALLEQIGDEYEVEPRFIVALMGMETDYGTHTGNFLVLQSLATLAYDGRRRDLFEKELIDALHILAQGKLMPYDLVGSWAGAMGNCQFMPSSYLKYAVDWDKDGKADIWHSLPDTFASIANYLHQSGWQKDMGWGTVSTAADAVYPGTPDESGYVPTANFDVIMKWNRSRYFASSVGILADQLQ